MDVTLSREEWSIFSFRNQYGCVTVGHSLSPVPDTSPTSKANSKSFQICKDLESRGVVHLIDVNYTATWKDYIFKFIPAKYRLESETLDVFLVPETPDSYGFKESDENFIQAVNANFEYLRSQGYFYQCRLYKGTEWQVGVWRKKELVNRIMVTNNPRQFDVTLNDADTGVQYSFAEYDLTKLPYPVRNL